MKIKLALATLLAMFAGSVLAGPLIKEHVDQNAKWLLHIDFDHFRASRLGQFLVNDVIVKQVEAAKAQGNSFLSNMDVVKIISQLHSLTAYGTSFETGEKIDGVLLLQVEPETRKILEGAAAGLLLNDDGTLTKTNEGGMVLYSLKEQFFASPQDNGTILFSKSKANIKQAAALLAGKGRNLAHSKTFTDFPPIKDSFILLAVAEGFQDNLHIPPQAKVLQQADGARIVLGERNNNVFVNLALKAKDSEVVTQIQQVVEGIIALGSLSQSENKELQQLIQSVKVVATDKVLSVNAAYPVDSLIARANEVLAEKRKTHHKPERATEEKAEESGAGDSK